MIAIIAKSLPWDYFRLPAKRNCEFFDSALSCLAGRFLCLRRLRPRRSCWTQRGHLNRTAGVVLDAAGSVYGTTSNCGSAGQVYERCFRDYTVATRLSEMHNLSRRRLSLLNRDSDLHGVLDHTRVRRSSHADHIARRLPGAAAAATGDLEQHQQGEQEKAAGCPISMSLFSACHRNQANHRQGKQHCNIERAEGARHGRHQHGQSSRIDRKHRSSRIRTRCHRSG